MENRWIAVVVGAGLFVAGTMAGESKQARAELTPAAETAVLQLLPNASILGAGRETERGVEYFEVVVRDGDRTVEVEVTATGDIGEVESEIALADAPQIVQDEIARLAGSSIREAERHEIHGVARNGRFEAVVPPMIVYEVETRVDGRWKEIIVGEDGRLLSSDADGDDGSSSDDDSSSSDDDSSSSDDDSSSSDDDSSSSDDDPVSGQA